MRLRPRHAAAAGRTFKLCSLLLCYPDEELLAARSELAAAAADAAPAAATEALERFCAWWSAQEPLWLQQHYVETFDLHKRCGLYLTFYGEGDRRSRGGALLRLKRLYRAAGMPLESTELPDYLPVMLEFAAGAPDRQGEIVLREHRAALELLRGSLHERHTPYAGVMDAVCLATGEPSVTDRARAARLAAAGPPSEMVGLEPFVPDRVMPSAQIALSGGPGRGNEGRR
ncbi:MAG TPA: nitrate reductase molybdenum cofactor assembly chaperone [Solirubrobacteraceae bacterium]|nr:nitrate reductase molybdenum cofactor assembly chaperone [Solirubrobacteraceae bacterium]